MLRKIFLYPGPLWQLTAILAWLSAILGVLVIAPLFLLCILLGCSLRVQTFLLKLWFRWVRVSCFFRFEVENLGDYNPAAPCLIVSNHQSFLDIPAAYFAFSGNVRMVGKRELFWIPLFGQVLSAGGFIPIFRGNKSSSAKVLWAIKRAFGRGIQVWVAPEGTRSPDGNLAEYRWGTFGLAIAAQVPVQPMVVLDSYKALSKNNVLPRVGATIRSVILPQISTLGLQAADKQAIAKKVQELSQAALEQHGQK